MSYTLRFLDRVQTEDEISDLDNSDEIFFEYMNMDFHEITMEAVSDVIDKMSSDGTYCGDPAELEWMCNAWHEEATELLQNKYGDEFCVEILKDGRLLTRLCKPVDEVIEYFHGDEQWDVNSGKLVLVLVENFLKFGEWQSGFRRNTGEVIDIKDSKSCILDASGNWLMDNFEKLEPIIWFGVKNDPPTQCWTIDKSEFQLQKRSFNRLNEVIHCDQWQAFWHSYFWTIDWETLIPFGIGSMTTWMFAECGMDEPEDEFLSVLKDCPIDLRCQNSEDLFELIDSFFLKIDDQKI